MSESSIFDIELESFGFHTSMEIVFTIHWQKKANYDQRFLFDLQDVTFLVLTCIRKQKMYVMAD